MIALSTVIFSEPALSRMARRWRLLADHLLAHFKRHLQSCELFSAAVVDLTHVPGAKPKGGNKLPPMGCCYKKPALTAVSAFFDVAAIVPRMLHASILGGLSDQEYSIAPR